ncbi:hypothetical protein KIPB_004891 [Kipferlia bialata]|uniref:Uncharacterized protein n=1 Tax=Kipferlia bialata TaxID=797122 RepID=A0A9K3GHS0_9EUKA|nr:hypothetical protein KIPB_004891 [Kipferlia bialata]|eukprot:g4891.t1
MKATPCYITRAIIHVHPPGCMSCSPEGEGGRERERDMCCSPKGEGEGERDMQLVSEAHSHRHSAGVTDMSGLSPCVERLTVPATDKIESDAVVSPLERVVEAVLQQILSVMAPRGTEGVEADPSPNYLPLYLTTNKGQPLSLSLSLGGHHLESIRGASGVLSSLLSSPSVSMSQPDSERVSVSVIQGDSERESVRGDRCVTITIQAGTEGDGEREIGREEDWWGDVYVYPDSQRVYPDITSRLSHLLGEDTIPLVKRVAEIHSRCHNVTRPSPSVSVPLSLSLSLSLSPLHTGLPRVSMCLSPSLSLSLSLSPSLSPLQLDLPLVSMRPSPPSMCP